MPEEIESTQADPAALYTTVVIKRLKKKERERERETKNEPHLEGN